jgi:hypothetical protein
VLLNQRASVLLPDPLATISRMERPYRLIRQSARDACSTIQKQCPSPKPLHPIAPTRTQLKETPHMLNVLHFGALIVQKKTIVVGAVSVP